MNALGSDEVGQFLNRYFVSSFQRVGTFKINGSQKQGGNVAAYFCAPDGRVLHAIAGPVKADALLAEAKWVVKSAAAAVAQSGGNAGTFRRAIRKAHADRLEEEYGLRVTPFADDAIASDLQTAASARSKDGKVLTTALPLPPLDKQAIGRRPLDNAARVHQLLAGHATAKIENLYGAIFEGILGEKVSTQPVLVATPFPWVESAQSPRLK